MGKISRKLKTLLLQVKNFGSGIAFAELKSAIFKTPQASYKRYEKIKNYLRAKYSDVIDRYAQLQYVFDETGGGCIDCSCPIWIFWYQGIENAPDIVKMCTESVKRNAHDHPVILIDKDNYKDYVNIPEHILSKINEGKISLTHFSDILRFNLLADHGGIYLDSTVFVTNDSGEDVFDWSKYSLYTCHTEIRPETDVAKGAWVSYIFATSKGNPFAKYMVDMFNAYWVKENMLITYLMIDCMIAIAYEEIPWAKEMIDAVPPNNCEIYELAQNANSIYADELYKKAISCPFHKLTYKKEFYTDRDGQETIWGRFTKDFVKEIIINIQ